MNNDEFYEMTRKFLLGESKESTTLDAYIKSIKEYLENTSPRSLRESKKLSIAKENLHKARRLAQKLEENVLVLKEQVKVLKEGKE